MLVSREAGLHHIPVQSCSIMLLRCLRHFEIVQVIPSPNLDLRISILISCWTAAPPASCSHLGQTEDGERWTSHDMSAVPKFSIIRFITQENSEVLFIFQSQRKHRGRMGDESEMRSDECFICCIARCNDATVPRRREVHRPAISSDGAVHTRQVSALGVQRSGVPKHLSSPWVGQQCHMVGPCGFDL